jgi:hypothetical protein
LRVMRRQKFGECLDLEDDRVGHQDIGAKSQRDLVAFVADLYGDLP